MKSLLIVLLCYYANHAAGFDESDIVFCIFAQQPRNISYSEFNLLPETGFNKKLPTVFVIHGYQSGYALLESFRQAWTSLATKMNLIGIDWSKGSSTWNYNTAVTRTPTVGSAVGQFIMSSIRSNLIPDPRIVHVVGHSLGAHIAGFVGKYMARDKPFPVTLEHITALDPAGPFIGSYDCSRRLCVTDAAFVETLHTNGGSLGMWDPIGSLDMYLNGGTSQPGCWLPTCSHSFSHEWYRRVLDKTPGTPGWLCNDLQQLRREKYCKVDGNPRRHRFDIIQQGTKDAGIEYVATDSSKDNVTSTTMDIGTNTMENGGSDTRAPNYTNVVFGPNHDNVKLFLSLVGQKGHLVVERRNDDVVVVTPTNPGWKPDSKYIVCNETEPERVASFLRPLQEPLRVVVAFDAGDMFAETFWKMTISIHKYLDSVRYASEGKLIRNIQQFVALHIPHDGISLREHCKLLEREIHYGLYPHHLVNFDLYGVHVITKTGAVSEMPELKQELDDIKNALNGYSVENSTADTPKTTVKEEK